MNKNKYDNRDSLELGETAQQLFKETATQRGWKCVEATPQEDINEHWDFRITNDVNYTVDVKSTKRINSYDKDVQDDWLWIELHGVKDRGWLYGGKADFIAFQTSDSFLLVKRIDLITLLKNRIDYKTPVFYAQDAKYKSYTRRDRKDKITLVETSLVETIKWDCWKVG